MRVGAITAEFNPLHKGHQYIIGEAKKDCDVLIVLLSGAFTQRGEPVSVSKFHRAKDAIQCGADIVITHPIYSATSYGDKFTQGAIKTLLKFPNLSAIYCGIEDANPDVFYRMLDISSSEFPQSIFQKTMDAGSSYTEALKRAYTSIDPEYGTLFRPNGILAMGYGRTLASENALSLLKLIPRIKKSEGEPIPSATKIRSWQDEGAIERVRKSSVGTPPQWSIAVLREKLYPLYRSHILTSMGDLSYYDGYEVGLENRIERTLREQETYTDFLAAVTTRRYSAPRIQRLLLHYTLGTTRADIDNAIEQQQVFQLLGLSKGGRDYLRALKDGPLQLIQNFSKISTLPEEQRKYLQMEERGSLLHHLLTNSQSNMDYVEKIYYRQ